MDPNFLFSMLIFGQESSNSFIKLNITKIICWWNLGLTGLDQAQARPSPFVSRARLVPASSLIRCNINTLASGIFLFHFNGPCTNNKVWKFWSIMDSLTTFNLGPLAWIGISYNFNIFVNFKITKFRTFFVLNDLENAIYWKDGMLSMQLKRIFFSKGMFFLRKSKDRFLLEAFLPIKIYLILVNNMLHATFLMSNIFQVIRRKKWPKFCNFRIYCLFKIGGDKERESKIELTILFWTK